MPALPTIAEIDREIAELELWAEFCEGRAKAKRARIAELEQQRADLGLQSGERLKWKAPVMSEEEAREQYEKFPAITNAELLDLAKSHQPPQAWYDEEGIPATLSDESHSEAGV